MKGMTVIHGVEEKRKGVRREREGSRGGEVRCGSYPREKRLRGMRLERVVPSFGLHLQRCLFWVGTVLVTGLGDIDGLGVLLGDLLGEGDGVLVGDLLGVLEGDLLGVNNETGDDEGEGEGVLLGDLLGEGDGVLVGDLLGVLDWDATELTSEKRTKRATTRDPRDAMFGA